MKLSVVALFAAGAMAAVVPDSGSYGEEPSVPAPAPEPSYGEEAPAPSSEAPAPSVPATTEGESPEPTSAPEDTYETVTDVTTVTDCGPEVSNCAGGQTSTVDVTTSICETESEQPTEAPSAPESESPQPTSSEEECEEETPAPSYSEAPSSAPEEAPTSAPLSTGDSSPAPTSVCEPQVNVKTITTEYTTVVPTTILETETIPCEEPTAPESGVGPAPTGVSSSSPVPTGGEGEYPEPAPSAPGNET